MRIGWAQLSHGAADTYEMTNPVPQPPGDRRRRLISDEDHQRPAPSVSRFDALFEPTSDMNVLVDRRADATAAAAGTLERDQTLAERDQTLADRDQTLADRDLARGGDPAEHDLTREIRDQSARQREEDAQVREQGAQGRVDTGAERDAVAQARDLAALARDEASALRDRQLGVRDAVWASNGRAVTGAEVLLRAGEYRKLAAADRIAGLEGRARAAADREQAARDRDQSARDRE